MDSRVAVERRCYNLATVTEFSHPARPDPAHSGVLRTIYFLALAAVAFFTVLTAIRGFYDPPDGNTVDFPPGFEDTGGQSDFQQAQDEQRTTTATSR